MAPIIPLLMKAATLFQTIKPLILGEKEQFIAGAIIPATKGLLQSKTVKAATGSLLMKLAGCWMIPGIPEWMRMVGAGAFIIEWGASLYLRIITKEKVGRKV